MSKVRKQLLTFCVMTVREATAASFVSPRPPYALDQTLSLGCVAVLIVVSRRRGIFARWQSESLDMAIRQTHG